MQALACSLKSDVHAAAPADPVSVSPAEFNDALAAQLQRLPVRDLLEELGECPQFLEAAIERKDAALIGRIVLTVREAMAARAAEFEVYGSSRAPTAEQAAALACISGSVS